MLSLHDSLPIGCRGLYCGKAKAASPSEDEGLVRAKREPRNPAASTSLGIAPRLRSGIRFPLKLAFYLRQLPAVSSPAYARTRAAPYSTQPNCRGVFGISAAACRSPATPAFWWDGRRIGKSGVRKVE